MLEHKHADDTWYFSGPLCAPFALTLSLYAFISSRLLCSALCWLSPHIHHSTSWPWCLSLSLPVALPNTHAHTRAGVARCPVKTPFLASLSFSLSLVLPCIILAYNSAFLSSHLPCHAASDLPPTWPPPGTDGLFLERSLSFSLFFTLSAHAKKKKGVLCLYMACERVRFFFFEEKTDCHYHTHLLSMKTREWKEFNHTDVFSFLSHFHKTNPKSSFWGPSFGFWSWCHSRLCLHVLSSVFFTKTILWYIELVSLCSNIVILTLLHI